MGWLIPWQGAALALVAALAWGWGFRALRRPGLAGAALGVGLLLGWVATLGLVTASPRQLAERLPLLVLVLVPLLAIAGWRAGWPVAVLASLAAGWWLSGAPLILADWRRAAPEILGIAALALALRPRLDLPWPGVPAAAALGLGLALAGPPGPWPWLAAGLAGAAAGAALARAAGGAVLLAVGLAAVSALPVIARGAPADWAMAAAAPLLLWARPLARLVRGKGRR